MPVRKSILVVDDERETASLLEAALPPGEWSVEPESSADRALRRLARRPYGAVLAALDAPGVGGAEFIHSVHRLRPDAKVVIASSSAAPADVLESIKAHAFAHFSKPLDVEALVQMVVHAADVPAWTDGIEVLSATPHWIELRVRCRMVTADRLVQFLREMKMDLAPEEREGIATAFREMLVNAMEYGGAFDPEQTVDVSYIRTGHSLMYCIADPGSGFSLHDLPHAALSNPDNAPSRHLSYRTEHGMRAGGFGILFARSLVDELVYNELGNKVLLVKYLEHQGHREETPAPVSRLTPIPE
jgi:CheY-like chemotaxis protein/anti-sigma regulatory factor (Ser/Thr protein kinase)